MDSLSNPNRPVPAKNLPESNIEMHWDVFAGDLADYLLAAFALRAAKDGVKPVKAEQAEYFRSHLERGINQLQSTKDLVDLFKRTKAVR
jgi:DNA sulfur modification protein DndE